MRKRIVAILIIALVITLTSGYSFADTNNRDINDSKILVSSNQGVFINPAFSDVLSEADIIDKVASHSHPEGLNAVSSSSYESDEGVIVETIRNSMVNRENHFSIMVSSDNEIGNEEINNWFNLAIDETDSPIEGDYLRWVYGGYSYSWENYIEDGKYYTTVQLDIVYYTTKEQEDTLTEEFNRVMDSFGFTSSTSDYDKVLTIYDYITSNVAYDYQNLNNAEYMLKHTAYAALMNKTAVCQGYATLLYRMLRTAGIDARIITGISHEENHAWNIVKLDGSYYFLDSTWDAGMDQYSYFLKGSDSFPDHESEEMYLNEDFTEKYPISGSDYLLPNDKIIISGDFKFLVSLNEAKLVKYLGNDAEVVVPASVDGYPVTTIGISAFKGNSTLEYLTFSEGIETIEQESIISCDSLKEIYLPASLKIPMETGDEMFVTGISNIPQYCYKLEKINVAKDSEYLTDIDGVLFDKGMSCILCYPSGRKDTEYVIPDGIKAIGSSSFSENDKIEKISMPDTVTFIGYWAFNCCFNLKEINISNNCEVIGQYAFNLTAIKEIYIPASMKDIGSPRGIDCTHLEEWIVDSNNATYCSVDGVLFNKDMTVLLDIPFAKEGDLILPNSVVNIYEGAAINVSISSITIPAITSIQKNNFFTHKEEFTIYGYEGSSAQDYAEKHDLNFVSIGVMEEEEIASGKCGVSMTWSLSNKGLLLIKGSGQMSWDTYESPWEEYRDYINKIVIEEGPENICQGAFNQETCVNEVLLPSSLKIIEAFAFNLCKDLKTISIPEGVEELGNGAFSYCGLSDISLPSSLRVIGKNAFSSCPLKNILISPQNKYYIFKNGALFDKEMKTLFLVSYEQRDSYYVPDGVEIIGSSAFKNAMIGSVYLSDSVKCIEDNAFGDSSIYSIYLGNNVSEIKTYAFYSCQALETVILGNKIETIDERAFTGVYSLKTIYYLGTEDDWNEINIKSYNSEMYNADIKYTNANDLCSQGIHFLRYNERKEATCTECGNLENYHCQRCGKYFQSYRWINSDDSLVIPENDVLIPPIGSHAEMIKVEAKEPTCTEEGNIEYWTCSRCNKLYNDAEGNNEYTKEETIIPALGHDWGAWEVTQAATCTSNGQKQRDCSRCEAHETEIINADGHKFKKTVTPATLTKNGSIVETCSVCGEKTTKIIYYPKTIKLSETSYAYNGSIKKPTLTVKDSKGKNLIKGTDYNVSIPSGRKAIGEYMYKVNFRGNYSGEKTLSITINPPKVSDLKLTSPKSKQLKVTYSKASGGVSYQIWYRVKGTSTWTKKTATGTSKTYTSLKGGKTYQVKVRAYKKVDGTTYYGAWTAIKSLKVKN